MFVFAIGYAYAVMMFHIFGQYNLDSLPPKFLLFFFDRPKFLLLIIAKLNKWSLFKGPRRCIGQWHMPIEEILHEHIQLQI